MFPPERTGLWERGPALQARPKRRFASIWTPVPGLWARRAHSSLKPAGNLRPPGRPRRGERQGSAGARGRGPGPCSRAGAAATPPPAAR